MNIVTPLKHFDFDEIERVSRSELGQMVEKIDSECIYPENVMRALGSAGAFANHLDGFNDKADLTSSIIAMARASEECLSTGFCCWCQDALGWYISSSENDFLKAEILPQIAHGESLGGTGMSNPMKALAEIETMKLNGERVEGGYRVRGILPWVSNVTDDSYFGSMFKVEVDGQPKLVMSIFHAAWDGVTLREDHDFVAMGGTATCNVQIKDVFVPDDYVLADPANAFIKKMRAGFILMQCGMAAGIIKNCIQLMREVETPLGHVNQYLERQPDDLDAEYKAFLDEVLSLARTPYDASKEYFKRVLQARLKGGELSVEAAHWAQLHCGARGYVTKGAAQRRLREAYFVAIVTPATKHLRKLIAGLEA